MKVPSSLWIGGVKWSVKWEENLDGGDALGLCDYDTNTLSLNTSIKDNKYRVALVLMHEILHAIHDKSSVFRPEEVEREEVHTNVVSHGLMEVLVHNKPLMKMLENVVWDK